MTREDAVREQLQKKSPDAPPEDLEDMVTRITRLIDDTLAAHNTLRAMTLLEVAAAVLVDEVRGHIPGTPRLVRPFLAQEEARVIVATLQAQHEDLGGLYTLNIPGGLLDERKTEKYRDQLMRIWCRLERDMKESEAEDKEDE